MDIVLLFIVSYWFLDKVEESVGFSSLTKASFLYNVNYSFVPNGG